MVGKTILHYRIVEKIGEGGMGVVYKAHDLKLDRFVALKILPSERMADVDRKRRFVNEARTASALSHPNIVTVHDIAEADGASFIVMEYVPGKTLDQRIGRSGLRVSDTLKYAVQIAGALAKAHSAGIVHRDLKPSNIIVTDDGVVKILDFGLAKLKETSARGEFAPTAIDETGMSLTEAGAIVGTVAYMSPEQAEAKSVDSRSDIFSFGSVLYEMLTGKRAFQGDSKISTLSAILGRDPAPLSAEIPRDVEKIIARCLRKDPDRRFQHAEDLKVALEELKEESDSGRLASGISAALPRSGAWSRGRMMAAAAISVVVLMALTATVTWFVLHPASSGRPPAREGMGTARLNLLLSSEARAYNPSISADGKMIVYVAEDQGREDLFVTRVAGGARVRLTNDEAQEATPEFSPDGERISFTRVAPDSRLYEIWVIPTLGGPATRVLSNAQEAAWSPDGRRLTFVSRRPGQPDVLAMCDANGGDFVPLLHGDGNYPFLRHPSWAPDGSQLAVVKSTGGIAGELWLVPLKGGTPHRPWTDPPGVFINEPVFSVDGRDIVHQSNRAGATNLWSLPVSGGPPSRLTTGAGPDESPTVARNGVIAFLNARSRCALSVCVLRTGERREILSHSGYVWGPAFSPKGDELAVCRYETDGLWHIWIVPVSGGSARQLTSGSTPEMYPRFSPDGKSVFYHTWSPGPDRVWRVPLAGGPPVPVTPPRDEDDAYADVSPDGKWIAFARTEKGITRVYLAPAAGGAATLLIDEPSTVPRWSPDGRRIAFSGNRGYTGGVFVIGRDGAGLQHLSETGSWPVWWPDGKRLGFQGMGADGNEEIFEIPSNGGPAKPLRIYKFRGVNNPFDFSADGTLLSTSNCAELSSEIWLMEPASY